MEYESHLANTSHGCFKFKTPKDGIFSERTKSTAVFYSSGPILLTVIYKIPTLLFQYYCELHKYYDDLAPRK